MQCSGSPAVHEADRAATLCNLCRDPEDVGDVDACRRGGTGVADGDGLLDGSPERYPRRTGDGIDRQVCDCRGARRRHWPKPTLHTVLTAEERRLDEDGNYLGANDAGPDRPGAPRSRALGSRRDDWLLDEVIELVEIPRGRVRVRSALATGLRSGLAGGGTRDGGAPRRSAPAELADPAGGGASSPAAGFPSACGSRRLIRARRSVRSWSRTGSGSCSRSARSSMCLSAAWASCTRARASSRATASSSPSPSRRTSGDSVRPGITSVAAMAM